VTQQTTQSSTPTSQLDLAQEFISRKTPVSVIRGVLHRYPAESPAVVLIIAIIVFGVINGRFLAPANL
jgi:fructose transport system permease protein